LPTPSRAIRPDRPPPDQGQSWRTTPALDKDIYRERNQVERCFNRLKHWRDLAARYAKRASIYRACLVLIAALIWLR
jgi:transposase